ncbi:lysophospholipid acyltransferase family protein [Metabacillus sp. 113a]|uniref:lysophospholipid acyltransferase family protein n=1 Tax=Metabacillus sp. 113a TaxID=3404706 RepID=UPI003CE6D300
MYTFFANLARIILRATGKIEVKNKHCLPADGGYVVTCSHSGWLDVAVLGISMPRPVHFMAKQELFRRKGISAILYKINAFPINRENPSPSSIKTPVKLLKSGKIVGIFPSGTRTAEEVPAKRGAVTIANLARVPIVPAIYEGPGTFKAWLKVRKATLTFGEPFYVESARKDQIGIYVERLTVEPSRNIG